MGQAGHGRIIAALRRFTLPARGVMTSRRVFYPATPKMALVAVTKRPVDWVRPSFRVFYGAMVNIYVDADLQTP